MRTSRGAKLSIGLAGFLSLALVAQARGGPSPDAASPPAPAAVAAEPSVSEPTVIGPSGLPVPRFVALKRSEVHGRFGPGFDYPVAAVYRKAGLPVRVVAETRDDVWRRIEDAEGQRVWVHRSMLKANSFALVTTEDAVLRARPQAEATGRARLTAGVLSEVLECEAGWCRVRAGEFKGWVEAGRLWGAPEA